MIPVPSLACVRPKGYPDGCDSDLAQPPGVSRQCTAAGPVLSAVAECGSRL
jgi:hypothetical protein